MLLRRFDAATLARVRGVSEEAARATLEELAGHEWTYSHDVAGRGLVVEVKASIRDQLERYLQERRGADLRAARDAIGRALGPVLREPDAVQKPPELIDAALRAMGGVAAGRAWFALEANIGADWGSALGLTRFLLGDENAAADGESILGCAVRATHVSALIHEHPDLDVSEQWRQIAAAMARHEQIAIVRMLRGRAHLGAIAAEGWAGTAPPEQLAFELVELMRIMGTQLPPFVGPWVIAAVEGLLELLERSCATVPNLPRLLTPDWWASLPLSPGLEAWAHVLRARAAALLGEPRGGQRRAAPGADGPRPDLAGHVPRLAAAGVAARSDPARGAPPPLLLLRRRRREPGARRGAAARARRLGRRAGVRGADRRRRSPRVGLAPVRGRRRGRRAVALDPGEAARVGAARARGVPAVPAGGGHRRAARVGRRRRPRGRERHRRGADPARPRAPHARSGAARRRGGADRQQPAVRRDGAGGRARHRARGAGARRWASPPR